MSGLSMVEIWVILHVPTKMKDPVSARFLSQSIQVVFGCLACLFVDTIVDLN